MKSREEVILENLVFNEEYARKVIPFLTDEYFSDSVERNLFSHIKTFIEKYNSSPSVKALGIIIENDDKLTGDEFTRCEDYLTSLSDDKDVDMEWLVD